MEVSMIDGTKPYEELGKAIVHQAIMDYIELARSGKKRPKWLGSADKKWEQKEKLEKFFLSDDCELLGGIHGPTLLRKLKEEYVGARRIG